MAGVEFLLHKEYGYVAFVLVFYGLFNLWKAAKLAKPVKGNLLHYFNFPQFFFSNCVFIVILWSSNLLLKL